MNKYIISSILVIASAMTMSAVSAESGTTSTGTTSTGTTATGTTATGTGIKCTTASGVTQADNQAALLAAQQAFSIEIARLVSVKQAAYSGAQTLTGSARVEAMKSANVAFRTGFKAAIQKLSAVKRDKRSNHQEIRECREEKKEVKKEQQEERKEKREEIKTEIKSLQERMKALREKRDEARGHSGDHR